MNQHEIAQVILTVPGSDGGFWAFVPHVLFDWKRMFFRTWIKGPVTTKVSHSTVLT